MHVLRMYVYIDAPIILGVLYMYVCMHVCMYYVCMYVCTPIGASVLLARRYIHTFSIRAYLTWDTSIPHNAPIRAPNGAPNGAPIGVKHTYIHYTYRHACIHRYIVLPVLSARRYTCIHTFSIRAYLTWDTSIPRSAPISAPIRDRRTE